MVNPTFDESTRLHSPSQSPIETLSAAHTPRYLPSLSDTHNSTSLPHCRTNAPLHCSAVYDLPHRSLIASFIKPWVRATIISIAGLGYQSVKSTRSGKDRWTLAKAL
ncbi:hypothetical protein J6590_041920 [Homalodisca vitripennis]|nr:hypothetical protein J6590_041920 [Homalodisca vitripennis]